MFSWIANEKPIQIFLEMQKMHIFSKIFKKNRFRFSTEKPGSPVFSGSVQEPVFRILTEAKNRFFGLTVSGSPSL